MFNVLKMNLVCGPCYNIQGLSYKCTKVDIFKFIHVVSIYKQPVLKSGNHNNQLKATTGIYLLSPIFIKGHPLEFSLSN